MRWPAPVLFTGKADRGQPKNKTAVDDPQSNENDQNLFKVDKKVSFKSLCPWPFQSLEIKFVKSQSNSPKLHGEFLFKKL